MQDYEVAEHGLDTTNAVDLLVGNQGGDYAYIVEMSDLGNTNPIQRAELEVHAVWEDIDLSNYVNTIDDLVFRGVLADKFAG